MPLPAPNQSRLKVEQVIASGLVLLLLLTCLLVLRPFISALLWAVVLCFSTWPAYRRLTVALGQRRTLAAVVMGVGLLLILILPLTIIGSTLADNVRDLAVAARRSLEQGPPAPPAWLRKMPVIGHSASDYWQSLTQNTATLWTEARRFIEPLSSWLLRLGLSIGSGLMELGLSVLISLFLFRDGACLATRLSEAVDRIGGKRGQHLLAVAGNTVRGVVYGVLGTALVQAILMGVGLLVAGVPGAGVLVLLTFFISVVPLTGPALVWIPAAAWLFCRGSTGWGIFLIIWGAGVNSVEHIIKPLLIGKGSDLPFLLIFFGVLGGAKAFGFIGVFLGPTLLAVGYRLVSEWGATNRAAIQAREDSVRDSKALRIGAAVGENVGDL